MDQACLWEFIILHCMFLPPATKLGQGNIFKGICDSPHRGFCLSACWDTTPCRNRHPPDQALPGTRHPPRTRAYWEIRSTRGRYASYWNTILFLIILVLKHFQKRRQEYAPTTKLHFIKRQTLVLVNTTHRRLALVTSRCYLLSDK